MTKSVKTAVVLFNLGGPNKPEDVRPFLFNLFNDPAIITVPSPFRQLLAWIISKKRTPEATEIYAEMGGKSPLLENTNAQARALEAALGEGFKCYPVMRYNDPRAQDVIRQVIQDKPERVILLPLYPQFSTTTTGSSVKEWRSIAKKYQDQLPVSTGVIGCYPQEEGFVSAMARLIIERIKAMKSKPRILLTAHGLPEKTINAGDPYQTQVEITADAIMAQIPRELYQESVVCYQSRVGPLKWIEPYTDAEIERAGGEGVSLCVVPIAFVSEHSETLVELDIEYGELAQEHGVPEYARVPTVSVEAEFIEGLATLVREKKEGMTHELRWAA